MDLIRYKISEKLINEGKDLSLDKAIEIARTYELPKVQLKSMESSSEVVHGVRGSSTEGSLRTHQGKKLKEHNHEAMFM